MEIGSVATLMTSSEQRPDLWVMQRMETCAVDGAEMTVVFQVREEVSGVSEEETDQPCRAIREFVQMLAP